MVCSEAHHLVELRLEMEGNSERPVWFDGTGAEAGFLGTGVKGSGLFLVGTFLWPGVQ